MLQAKAGDLPSALPSEQELTGEMQVVPHTIDESMSGTGALPMSGVEDEEGDLIPPQGRTQ